jgi:hypothetical protein
MTRIVESIHATAEPTAQPHCDDTREMIDHFRQLGLIQRRPAAFKAGNVMYVHPALMNAVRNDIRVRLDEMSRRAFLWGVA